MGAAKLLTAAGGGITLDAASTATDKTITIPAVTATVLTDSTGVLNIGSGQFYKDASGNVGIGTSSPSQKLHIAGGSSLVGVGQSYYTYTSDFGIGTPDSDQLQIFAGASNGIRFGNRTSGTFTERARIDSSGNLLVNRTSVISSGQYCADYDGNSRRGIVLNNSSATSGANLISFASAGSVIANISQSGASTVVYGTSSDYRLKEDVAPMTGALSVIQQLNPVTYKWKVDGSDGQGFIAHELAEVVPDAVQGEKDAVDAEGNPQYQGIDTGFLVATLTAAIQELKAVVDTQASTITTLTERITALEAK